MINPEAIAADESPLECARRHLTDESLTPAERRVAWTVYRCSLSPLISGLPDEAAVFRGGGE